MTRFRDSLPIKWLQRTVLALCARPAPDLKRSAHQQPDVPGPGLGTLRLANLVSDRISPRLVPEIEILPWRRTQVLALQVHPSPSRPHHLIQEGPAAGVHLRVGSTNRRADAELTEELRRFARGGGLDEQPMSGLNSEPLYFRAASESFASPRATRTRLARLVDRGLVREIGTGPQDPRRRYFLAERGPA